VALGGRRWPAGATVLPPATAERALRIAIRHHPLAARVLYLLLRLPRTGSWPDPHILAQQITVVALRPTAPPPHPLKKAPRPWPRRSRPAPPKSKERHAPPWRKRRA
jgi:hypothetical protein